MDLKEASKKIMFSQQPVITKLRQKGLLESKKKLKKIKLFEEFLYSKQDKDI